MKEGGNVSALSNKMTVDKTATRNIPLLGVVVSEITPELRQKYRLVKNASGLVVISVSSKSDAASKGLRPGDLLVELDRKNVQDFKTLRAWENEAAEMGQESAFVLIDRNGDRFFAVVRFSPAS